MVLRLLLMSVVLLLRCRRSRRFLLIATVIRVVWSLRRIRQVVMPSRTTRVRAILRRWCRLMIARRTRLRATVVRSLSRTARMVISAVRASGRRLMTTSRPLRRVCRKRAVRLSAVTIVGVRRERVIILIHIPMTHSTASGTWTGATGVGTTASPTTATTAPRVRFPLYSSPH